MEKNRTNFLTNPITSALAISYMEDLTNTNYFHKNLNISGIFKSKIEKRKLYFKLSILGAKFIYVILVNFLNIMYIHMQINI